MDIGYADCQILHCFCCDEVAHYLTPTSDFSDARRAVVQSATDLYGENSAEVEACIDGFNEAGIKK
ncbi:hypothetical protein GCM10009001_07040 [Virgibacillus siamensis]|uniref:Peptidase M4 C-terminal domain-containing protein n=1 Tax=Virgibacillus siamensis TaxID=480071 RepID=A0ABN1FLP7_9BACI